MLSVSDEEFTNTAVEFFCVMFRLYGCVKGAVRTPKIRKGRWLGLMEENTPFNVYKTF